MTYPTVIEYVAIYRIEKKKWEECRGRESVHRHMTGNGTGLWNTQE